MAIPETDLTRIRRFVERRNEEIPPDARGEIRIEMDATPTSVTILECRPPWRPEYGRLDPPAGRAAPQHEVPR